MAAAIPSSCCSWGLIIRFGVRKSNSWDAANVESNSAEAGMRKMSAVSVESNSAVAEMSITNAANIKSNSVRSGQSERGR